MVFYCRVYFSLLKRFPTLPLVHEGYSSIVKIYFIVGNKIAPGNEVDEVHFW